MNFVWSSSKFIKLYQSYLFTYSVPTCPTLRASGYYKVSVWIPCGKKVVHHDTNTQGHTHEAIDIQMCKMRNLWKYLYKCVVGDNTNNIVLHTECGATVVIWSAGSQAGEVNKGGSPVSGVLNLSLFRNEVKSEEEEKW